MTIQIAIAKVDLWLCQMAAWPWKQMALSVILAAVVIHVIKAYRRDTGSGW